MVAICVNVVKIHLKRMMRYVSKSARRIASSGRWQAQMVQSEAKDRAAPDGKAENADLFGSVTLGDNNG